MNELTSTTAKFYRHSGKAPLMGLLLIGLAGFFFGLLADHIGWVSWIAAMLGDPSFLLGFFFPFEVFTIIKEIAWEGTWSISGSTPTGGALYFIWFVEACIVIGGSTYLSFSALSETPFCEDSDAWADKKTVLEAFTPVANAQQFKDAVARGNFAPFNELKPAQAGSRHFTLLETYECEQCKSFFVLNVKNVAIKINSKGRPESKVKPIVSNLIVTPTTLASLRKLAEVQPAAAITP